MNKSSVFLNRLYAKLVNIEAALMFWTSALLILGYFIKLQVLLIYIYIFFLLLLLYVTFTNLFFKNKKIFLLTTLCIKITLLIKRYFLFDTNYEGLPYIWLIGLPFIILLVIIRRDCRYNMLMVDSNKFDCLNQAIQ